MESEDLDLRSFYRQTYALLPTVSKRTGKVNKLKDLPNRTSSSRSRSKIEGDAMGISTVDKFTMNCRRAFMSFARPFAATGGRQEHGMPFADLSPAVGLVHGHISAQQISKLADTRNWTANELISFEEFRMFAWQLFQDSLAADDAHPELKSPVSESHSHSHSHSPSKSHSVDSFEKLSRQQHFVSTASIDRIMAQPQPQQPLSTTASGLSKAASAGAGGLTALEKDAVCEVVKRENRDKRVQHGKLMQ
jgi:hypothetical protein